MTTLSLGRVGAKRETWKGDTAKAEFLRIKMAHPRAGVEKWAKELMEEAREDDDILYPIMVYYCTNQDRNSNEQAPKREKTAKEKLEFKKEVEFVKRKLTQAITLATIMPNGESLADCTFRYVGKLGGQLSGLGRLGNAKQKIATVLTDNKKLAAALKGRLCASR